MLVTAVRIAFGMIIGAILVKESRRCGELYDRWVVYLKSIVGDQNECQSQEDGVADDEIEASA